MQIVASEIASAFDAMLRSRTKPEWTEWEAKHRERIESLVSEYLPSGSGFDSGTQFDFERSKPNRLVFTTSFHHMDEGMYDGWTEHDVIVTPSLALGFDLRITGRDRNGIKDYIAEIFQEALSQVLSCRVDCRVRQTIKRFVSKEAGFAELKQAGYGYNVTPGTPGDNYR